MQEGLSLLRVVLMSLLSAMLFAGCASKAPAPLETRAPSRQAAAEAGPAVARPGYYLVKKGDTLYSIAHQYDRDYRELVAWNHLDNANVIKVGQELRVTPAEAEDNSTQIGAVAVAPATVIDSRPLTDTTPVAPASAPVAAATSREPPTAPVGQKTEPKGGRVPYSAQAWKDLQAVEKTAPAAAATSVPASQSAAAPGKPAESKAVAEDALEWSWPGGGKVLATFNDSTNKGVDIAGSVGDPVLAAGAGRVVYVGSGLRGYGNLVIIKHNASFLSAYAHNSEILVKEGQAVQKGQKIAALGNSDADRPKLHFEIRRQGKPVDPLKYLPAR